jgi:hypothetical protein
MRYKEIKVMRERLRPYNVVNIPIMPLKSNLPSNPSLRHFFYVYTELGIPYQNLTVSEMQDVVSIMQEYFISQKDKMRVLKMIKSHLLELKIWLSE